MQSTFLPLRFAAVGIALSLSLAGSNLQAGVVWQETVNGDLSNNGNSPTLVAVVAGTNSVIATMPGSDQDFLRINVPADHVFSALNLISYSSADGTSFIAIKSGTTNPPTGTPSTLLGYAHFGTGPGNVGLDILPDMGAGYDPGQAAMGFTPPLPSGDYAFWIQQASSAATSYQFDFVITPVATPEDLFGDYNENDVLDSADYTVWRDAMIAGSTALPNDPTPGTVDEADFEYWRDNFGDVPGSGAGSASAVPEPAGAMLMGLASVGMLLIRGRSRNSSATK